MVEYFDFHTGPSCAAIVVVLRGKLYADPRRPDGCGLQGAAFSPSERRALQTLNRAVQQVPQAADRSRPDRLLTFRDAVVLRLARPSDAPTPAAFTYADAPAIACDPFDCAVRVATEALASYFDARGFRLLGERDVLSTVTVANLKLQPLLFDDAVAKRDLDEPTRAAAVATRADRARVGKRGFFSKQAPIKIDLRASNTLDLRSDQPAGLDPARPR